MEFESVFAKGVATGNDSFGAFSFFFSWGRMRLEVEWNWSGSGMSDEFGIKLSLGVSRKIRRLGPKEKCNSCLTCRGRVRMRDERELRSMRRER